MEKLENKLVEMWKRISNWKSLWAIASALIIISKALKLPVDYQVLQTVIEAILTVLLVLGIINKEGMETTNWNE